MRAGLNGYEQAFLPIVQHNYEIVQYDTWGHLAMVKNKKHKGTILFGISEYNSVGACLVQTNFDNGLEDSPWLFYSLQEFIGEQKLDSGFYKWSGHIKNYKFTGEITKVN